MRRIGIIFMIIVLAVTLCSCKEKGETEYEGYGIKTTQKNGKITVETEKSKWSSDLDNEKEKNLSFALDVWNYIFAMKIDRDDPRFLKAKEIAVRSKIQSLAGRIKTGQTEFEKVKIYSKDIEKAFQYLDMTYIIIADMKGNGDGETGQTELDKLGEEYIDQLTIFLRVRDKYGIK
jgi:hypothetical protein